MPLNASFHLISRIFCEILLFMWPSWRHLRRRFGMKIPLKGTCRILLKICINFIKKWTPAKVFSCDCCEIFLINIRKKQKRKINFMKNELCGLNKNPSLKITPKFSFSNLTPRKVRWNVTLINLVGLTELTAFTAKTIAISPDFLVWKFCENAQLPHSFGQIARNYAETGLSAKFPHQKIKWNYGIFCSVSCYTTGVNSLKETIANIQYLSYSLSKEHMKFMMANKNRIQKLIFLKIWLFQSKCILYFQRHIHIHDIFISVNETPKKIRWKQNQFVAEYHVNILLPSTVKLKLIF